jgi:uncharacterized protein (TIGR02145 family)
MKTRLGLFLLMLLVLIGLTFCEKPDPTSNLLELHGSYIVKDIFHRDTTPAFVTDIDGNLYKVIQIGTQTWMAENLKTTKYNDGNPILTFTGDPDCPWNSNWFGSLEGAYCWYEFDEDNKKLGAIYNWHAVGTDKLCPTGWHVPTYSEWAKLITQSGGSVEPFNERTENAKIHWANYTIGFESVYAGELCGWGFLQNQGCWWTATPKIREHNSVPWAFLLNFEYFGFEPQSYGFNVRCMKD